MNYISAAGWGLFDRAFNAVIAGKPRVLAIDEKMNLDVHRLIFRYLSLANLSELARVNRNYARLTGYMFIEQAQIFGLEKAKSPGDHRSEVKRAKEFIRGIFRELRELKDNGYYRGLQKVYVRTTRACVLWTKCEEFFSPERTLRGLMRIEDVDLLCNAFVDPVILRRHLSDRATPLSNVLFCFNQDRIPELLEKNRNSVASLKVISI